NGRHGVHPHLVGTIHVANAAGPGWADPATGRLDDPRPKGRDGKPYGPMPRGWMHYRGQYRHRDRVVFAYTVGSAEVLETPALASGRGVVSRLMRVGAASQELLLRAAPGDAAV